MIGLCVPNRCSQNDMKKLFQDLSLGLPEGNKDVFDSLEFVNSKEFSKEKMNVSSILTFLLMFGYFSLVTYSSISFSKNQDETGKNLFFSIIKEFAIQKHLKTIFQVVKSSDNLQCLNGIRVLASLGILILHVYVVTFNTAFLNHETVLKLSKDLKHKFIQLFFYNVDLFFIISGLLMSYLTVPQVIKQGPNFKWSKFIFRRLIRYMPVYYFVCFFMLFMIKHLGDGPLWPMIDRVFPTCDKYWWTCFTFLQVLIPFGEVPCLSWVWYVSAEFMFFVVSSFIIKVYAKRKDLAYCIILAINLASMAYVGAVSGYYNFTPTFTARYSEKYHYGLTYTNPIARIQTFMIGLVLGFIYRTYKDNLNSLNVSEKSSEPLISFGAKSYGDLFELGCIKVVKYTKLRRFLYVLGIFLMLYFNLIVHQLDEHGKDYWAKSTKVAYFVFNHFLFGLGISFWILPMIMGYCSELKWLLSAGIFQVLAKISYSLYMIHSAIYFYVVLTRNQSIIFDDFYIFTTSTSLLMITVIAAFFVTATIEFPFLSLEKKYLRD